MLAILIETQKKAVRGKIVDYPVSQIQVIDNHTFSIRCRDQKNADTFKAITTAYNKTAYFAFSKERHYDFLEKSPTEFILRGKDAQQVLRDFSETGLLSNTLLTQVLNVANVKNLSCVIS